MGLHIEEAAAKAITFEIMRAGDIHSYEGDEPDAEVLVLDYGDSDGLLVIYGSKEEQIAMLERLREVVLWAGAPRRPAMSPEGGHDER